MNHDNSNQSGFTLLEMLVVLVLMSFLITLLMEGLAYVNQLTERVSRAVNEYEQQALRTQWLAQVLSGLYPVGRYESGAIKGSSHSLEATTLRSLRQPAGIAVPVRLQLSQSGQALEYSEKPVMKGWDDAVTVPIWLMQKATTEKTWHFQYQNKQGQWFDSWPPASGGIAGSDRIGFNRDDKVSPLPYAVCWCQEGGDDSDEIGVLVSIQSQKDPPFDLRDSQ